MKMFKNWGLALIACAALSLGVSPVVQAANVVPSQKTQQNVLFWETDAAGTYSNSTVTPTDVTDLTVTLPATTVPIARQFIETCWAADVTKATSTSGSLTVNISGSDVTASARQVQFGSGRTTMANCFVAPRATAAAVIVKLRGVSGDTALFTVHNAQMTVRLLYTPTV